jgi:hypothetical protein
MRNEFIVCWIKWNKTSPKRRPIYKFAKCKTKKKADSLKQNLIKQNKRITVYVCKIHEINKGFTI